MSTGYTHEEFKGLRKKRAVRQHYQHLQHLVCADLINQQLTLSIFCTTTSSTARTGTSESTGLPGRWWSMTIAILSSKST